MTPRRVVPHAACAHLPPTWGRWSCAPHDRANTRRALGGRSVAGPRQESTTTAHRAPDAWANRCHSSWSTAPAGANIIAGLCQPLPWDTHTWSRDRGIAHPRACASSFPDSNTNSPLPIGNDTRAGGSPAPLTNAPPARRPAPRRCVWRCSEGCVTPLLSVSTGY